MMAGCAMLKPESTTERMMIEHMDLPFRLKGDKDLSALIAVALRLGLGGRERVPAATLSAYFTLSEVALARNSGWLAAATRVDNV
jgi:hypothetical protein